jgi:hypothetical protein
MSARRRRVVPASRRLGGSLSDNAIYQELADPYSQRMIAQPGAHWRDHIKSDRAKLGSSFATPQTKCVWAFAAGDSSVILDASRPRK